MKYWQIGNICSTGAWGLEGLSLFYWWGRSRARTEKIGLKIGSEESPREKRRQYDTIESVSRMYDCQWARTLCSRKKRWSLISSRKWFEKKERIWAKREIRASEITDNPEDCHWREMSRLSDLSGKKIPQILHLVEELHYSHWWNTFRQGAWLRLSSESHWFWFCILKSHMSLVLSVSVLGFWMWSSYC